MPSHPKKNVLFKVTSLRTSNSTQIKNIHMACESKSQPKFRTEEHHFVYFFQNTGFYLVCILSFAKILQKQRIKQLYR
jgi:hypothetical protein